MKKILLILLIPILLLAEQVLVTIPRGASVGKISNILKEQKLIKNTFLFKVTVKLMKKENNFSYGHFYVETESSMKEIIQQLQNPQNLATVKITIPEGKNIFQIDKILKESGIINKNEFIKFVSNKKKFQDIINSNPYLKKDAELKNLEGFLFPDTYKLPIDITVKKIVQTMFNNFNKKVLPIYEQAKKANKLPKRLGKTLSFYKLISLASIVELEAVNPKERPIIASVFLNRMNRRMILGSCPTVKYAMILQGKPWPKKLLYKDTEIESDYNTYKNSGLPPSPIASLGLASIKAVLNPAKTNYLYFVSKLDGTHHFSKTEQEHNYWKRKLLD